MFFFSQQRPAYEMRISDWSSDVCSSDLCARLFQAPGCAARRGALGQQSRSARSEPRGEGRLATRQVWWRLHPFWRDRARPAGSTHARGQRRRGRDSQPSDLARFHRRSRRETGELAELGRMELGRESCRERVCKYVEMREVDVTIKKK